MRNHETTFSHKVEYTSIGHGEFMGNENENGDIYADENNNHNGNHVFSQDHEQKSSDRSNNNASSNDLRWDKLRQLLSHFHHLVDVELPALLEHTRTNASSVSTSHHGHGEISRNHFDLRRCFRNMQELLLKEELLGLLDEEDCTSSDGEDDVGTNGEFSHKNDCRKDASTNNATLLLRMLADDLVQLSTISDFDESHIDSNYDMNYSGIREMHRSLIVLAANRFPTNATLDDDQISQLLSRVLLLIQQESHSMSQQYTYEGTNYHPRVHGVGVQKNFEPLQSLLVWLNQEMTVDRLSEGVLLDHNEAATALQIVLECFDEIVSKPTISPSSSIAQPHGTLSPQFVLSMRILIDLLLGALNVLAAADNCSHTKSQKSLCNDSVTRSSSFFSLREWMSTSKHQKHHESFDYESLLRILDRYALELVEETLEILRPQPKLPPSSSSSGQHRTQLDSSEMEESEICGNNSKRHQDNLNTRNVIVGPSRRKTNVENSQRERVVKALQYSTTTTNFFSIMEVSAMEINEHKTSISTTASIFAGLSRSLWRALARFIIDEVDCLDKNNEDTVQYCGKYENDVKTINDVDAEECQIAATDVLFRLTKTQIQTIIFHGRNKITPINDGDDNNGNGIKRFRHEKLSSPHLSQEEFSIIVVTILRLLGHPNEFWTAETQAWVASLLQMKREHDLGDPLSIRTISSDPFHLDLAPKLRKVLQAALLCTSYVPDALPFDDQCRVHSSLRELLLPQSTSIEHISRRKRKRAEDCSLESTADTASKSDILNLVDPWEALWSSRQ